MDKGEAYHYAIEIFKEEEGRDPDLSSDPMSKDEIAVAILHTGIVHTLSRFGHLDE